MGIQLNAQFAPSASKMGTSAMHQDSSAFVTWAAHCDLQLGWQNIADTSLGKVHIGDSLSAMGKAGNTTVSLGDGGQAILRFDQYIYDGLGWDFAIFENSFSDDFLELGFVEVSSDGVNFFRFPAASLTQDTVQVGSFGTLDATKINNLAGKYRAGFGTPFNLGELSGISGLDIQKVTHVKIIDVVGSVNDLFASYDSTGNAINDPWPTPFASSGLDLSGVGLIHASSKVGLNEWSNTAFMYPNPAQNWITILPQHSESELVVLSLSGKTLLRQKVSKNRKERIDISQLENGPYLVQIKTKQQTSSSILTVYK